MTPELGLFLGVLGPALGLASAFGVALLTRQANREARIIADLRADLLDERTRREEAEAQQRLMADYAHVLRGHIVRGETPPPPPWPDGLVT